jgi:hypothetical protein
VNLRFNRRPCRNPPNQPSFFDYRPPEPKPKGRLDVVVSEGRLDAALRVAVSKYGRAPEPVIEPQPSPSPATLTIVAGATDICAICGGKELTGKALARDHDHVTGYFRGYLCSKCNVGLGFFRDNIELLTRAIGYLTLHQTPQEPLPVLLARDGLRNIGRQVLKMKSQLRPRKALVHRFTADDPNATAADENALHAQTGQRF